MQTAPSEMLLTCLRLCDWNYDS